MYFYAIMLASLADFLRKFSSGALYDANTLLLVGLTEAQINTFDGEIVRIDKLGFTTTEHDVTLTEVLTGLANRAAFTEADLAVIERIHANGGMSPSLLTGLIDYMRSEEHTGKLVILSIAQGEQLHKDHEAFKEPEVAQI